MSHKDFIFELKNTFKHVIQDPESFSPEKQKSTKFFLTEGEQIDDVIEKAFEMKVPMNKQQLLSLMVILEENNLFLLNNLQEDEQGVEEANKDAQKNINTYESKVSHMKSKLSKMEQKLQKQTQISEVYDSY